ncbi:MAG: hypothetical protein WAK55_02740 [Xanthobacteraceae bacterium]
MAPRFAATLRKSSTLRMAAGLALGLVFVRAQTSAITHRRTAEKLRDEPVKQTTKTSPPTYWTVHSAICLYHAALECFINEEITVQSTPTKTKVSPINSGYEIQSMTLHERKLDEFFSFFGLKGKNTPDITRRVLLLAGLRNRLAHHWPLLRDVRDYPVQVIDALTDAGIEKINTSWTAQLTFG